MQTLSTSAGISSTDRARKYLAAMPAAVDGQRGHDQTFAAATALARFGLDQSAAWPLLAEWNQRCLPPWNAAELKHKLRDAFRVARPDARFTDATPAQAQSSDATPEQKRERWPAFNLPTVDELARVFALRNIGVDGLRLAVARGVLRAADYQGARCWIVTDATRRNAQARKLDGQTFAKRDGEPVKALTLPGSRGSWPIGLEAAQPFPNILLCEGGPDLLAAHHFIEVEARGHDCAAVAILGSSNRLADSVLPHFAGKTVRIFPHLDSAGHKAESRWAASLVAVAAAVDAFDFTGLRRTDDQPVTDLNDACSIHPEDFEAHRCLWTLCP